MRMQDKRSPALTDTDLINFGKYVNRTLQDVPASYLKWLCNEMRPTMEELSKNYDGKVTVTGKIEEKLKLYNYIYNSLDAINQEIEENERD